MTPITYFNPLKSGIKFAIITIDTEEEMIGKTKMLVPTIAMIILNILIITGCGSSDYGESYYYQSTIPDNTSTPTPQTNPLTIPASSFNTLFTIGDYFYYYISGEKIVLFKISSYDNSITYEVLPELVSVTEMLHWKDDLIIYGTDHNGETLLKILDANLKEIASYSFPVYINKFVVVDKFAVGFNEKYIPSITYSPGEIDAVNLLDRLTYKFNIGTQPLRVVSKGGKIYLLTYNYLFVYDPATTLISSFPNTFQNTEMWISPDGTWVILFATNSSIEMVDIEKGSTRELNLPEDSSLFYFLPMTDSDPIAFIYREGKSYWGTITREAIRFDPVNFVEDSIDFASPVSNGIVMTNKYTPDFYFYSNGITKSYSLRDTPQTWIVTDNLVGGIIDTYTHIFRVIRLSDRDQVEYNLNFNPDAYSISNKYINLAGGTEGIIISLRDMKWISYQLLDPVVTMGFLTDNRFAVISNYPYGEITFGDIEETDNEIKLSLITKMGLLLNEAVEELR